MGKKKTILVAPLNWGLGHATRCIPIIRELLLNDFKVLLASDGYALELLQKEFPTLDSIKLPSYNISYPKNGKFLKWKLLRSLPRIKKAITSEKKIIQNLVSEKKIQGIINDNRFGVFSSKIPSVYITHQLIVLSGLTTFLTSKIHQNYINKFNECWIPDFQGVNSLSGKLSPIKKALIPIKYLGPLSRFKKIKTKTKYDILILLSGPEPQRTSLEKLLIEEFRNDTRNILMIQGLLEKEQKKVTFNNITCVNFMIAKDLEKAINGSELIIARSGYTTIMDLFFLEKKAFFIPTPGQFEQEYLAKHMKDNCWVPYCLQKEFSKDKLVEVKNYSEIKLEIPSRNIKELFSLFEGK